MILYLWILGLVMFGIEFVVPGIGFFGLAGAISWLAALFFTLGADLMAGAIVVIVALLGGLFLLWFINRFPQSVVGRRVTNAWRSDTAEGYVSHDDATDLVGKTGHAVSPLRPAGTATIDGNPVDVVTEGVFLDRGTPIEVIAVTGGRIVVRAVQ